MVGFSLQGEEKAAVSKRKRTQQQQNNQTDVALFYFTSKSTVVLYSTTKFMFSSHKLSRKYRYLDTNNGEFCLGLSLVQNVLWSRWSTSCVRFYSYFFHYSFYTLTQKQTPSENTASLFLTRQCAPTFKLRHLDLNLTQLIHLLRTNEFNQSISLLPQANDNEKKKSDSDNSNNDSDSSIIVSLHYSIIERVFQTDGECIAIRLSTLIDGKKQKKLSAEEDSNPICREEKVGTILLLTLLVLLSNNRKKQHDDRLLFIVSKRSDDASEMTLSSKVPIHIRSVEHMNNHEYTVYDINNDDKSINNNNEKGYIYNIVASVLILLLELSNYIDRYNKKNINNNNNNARYNKDNNIYYTVQNIEEQDLRNINFNSAEHIGRNVIVAPIPGQCEFIIALLILLSVRNKSRPEEEANIISVSLIDGECLLGLLSKLSICNRIVRNEDNFQDVILSSKHNDDDNNNMSVWTPSNYGEYIYIQVLLKRNNSASIMIHLLLNHNNNNNRKCIVIFLPNHIDEECNLIILSKGNDVSVTSIDVQPSTCYKKEERDKKCVIIILSKLSQCTISNKEERDDVNIIDSVLLLYYYYQTVPMVKIERKYH